MDRVDVILCILYAVERLGSAVQRVFVGDVAWLVAAVDPRSSAPISFLNSCAGGWGT